MTNAGFLFKKDLKNQDDDKALVIARNISDFCFVSSGIINDNTEFLLLVTKDGLIQQMNLTSLENIKTVRLTEDYIQPRFQSCTSGESHIAILDSSGSVWSTGSLIQVGKSQKQFSSLQFFQKNERNSLPNSGLRSKMCQIKKMRALLHSY